MGEAGYERAATDDELARMRAVVAEAMAAGAIGFATSSSPTHNGDGGRPVPSRLADLRRARHVARAAARARAAASCALLPGGMISNDEVFDLQRADRPPVHLDRAAHDQGLPLAREASSRTRGGPRRRHRGVAAGVVPAPRVPDEPHRAVHPQHAPDASRRSWTCTSRSASPRTAIRPGGRRSGRSWPVAVACSPSIGRPARWPNRRPAPTSSSAGVVDLAEERGCSPLDVLLDVSLDDDLRTRFRSVLANDDPDGIAWLLPRDHVLLGLADSGAHVSQLVRCLLRYRPPWRTGCATAR